MNKVRQILYGAGGGVVLTNGHIIDENAIVEFTDNFGNRRQGKVYGPVDVDGKFQVKVKELFCDVYEYQSFPVRRADKANFYVLKNGEQT